MVLTIGRTTQQQGLIGKRMDWIPQNTSGLKLFISHSTE